ncbi:MAG: hypothetical protein ACLQF0_10170 [Dissulfurispiraceae bacterium]
MSNRKITYAIGFFMILICSLFFASSCCKTDRLGLWERHCASCHDGKTILNGTVVMNRDQMKSKYKTLDEFSNACVGTASCMNILKHDKKLFIEVGKAIGIGS